MATVIDEAYQRAYEKLSKRFPLRPIRTEEENDLAGEVCDTLTGRADLTQAELDYLEVLSELIVKFETKTWGPEDIQLAPHELIQSLMDDNRLSTDDMVIFFDSKSKLNEFLRGETLLNISQAKRLAERFKLKLESLLV